MAKKLEEYKQKRNFVKTKEPVGASFDEQALKEKSKQKLRFVVQHHIARKDHFDFRLEWNGVLVSWAVPKGPSYNPNDKRLAIKVEDHPFDYRNFEGTIPKGEYGGGTVMLWDEGFWDSKYDVDKGLSDGIIKFSLQGKRLKGSWALIKIKDLKSKKEDSWLLLKEEDEYAKKTNGISSFLTSIRTGRNMSEIENGVIEKIASNPFSHTDVQLAKLVSKAPKGNDWLYEIKYDGYRIMAFVENEKVMLMTRNKHDYSDKFFSIASSIKDFAGKRAMILDGEIVVIDKNGKTDFQALQNYVRNPIDKTLTYVIFDILSLDGIDLRERKLIERKAILDSLLKDAPTNLYNSQYVIGKGTESFDAVCKLNLEGIVGKNINSNYSGTRNGDWIKMKCQNRQEFVICGYTLTDKKTSGISSLILGYYEEKNLIYAGRAGTGLTEKSMKELEQKFESLKIEKSPFILSPKLNKNEKIFWLKPSMVAEIKFAEWTKDNLLRQASFKGLRTDKSPEEITMEKENLQNETNNQIITDKDDYTKNQTTNDEAENIKTKNQTTRDNNKIKNKVAIVDGVKITNPNKVVFEDPEIKKIDVVSYYSKVARRMLPFLSHRILSVVRCPKGASEPCFFKKHPDSFSKGIVKFPIVSNKGEKEIYFYIENSVGIVSEAQMGTLEFHVWGSRIDDLEKPDMMVFDLDPDEGMDLKQVRQGVKDLKNILDELSLTSYLKTSGGKGYHIVVPFKPVVEWDKFYEFAKHIAEYMEKKWSNYYTSNVRKNSRKGKIFVDWIRNGRGSTAVAPYSIRARKGACVSMPITWEELDTIAPNEISMADALLRIEKKDPWENFYKNSQQLKF
ncbi:MAG: DNA ligase D [Clostridia bacterium]